MDLPTGCVLLIISLLIVLYSSKYTIIRLHTRFLRCPRSAEDLLFVRFHARPTCCLSALLSVCLFFSIASINVIRSRIFRYTKQKQKTQLALETAATGVDKSASSIWLTQGRQDIHRCFTGDPISSPQGFLLANPPGA